MYSLGRYTISIYIFKQSHSFFSCLSLTLSLSLLPIFASFFLLRILLLQLSHLQIFLCFTHVEDIDKYYIVTDMQVIIHTDVKEQFIATPKIHIQKIPQSTIDSEMNKKKKKNIKLEKKIAENKLPYAVTVVFKSHHEHTTTLFFYSLYKKKSLKTTAKLCLHQH